MSPRPPSNGARKTTRRTPLQDPGPGPFTPALYRCVIAHARTHPVRHAFRFRTSMWLTDVDEPPRLPRLLRPLARFEPRDHFGGTAPTVRAGLERYVAAQGVDLEGGRVLMLAHARVFGHVFNPLTLYWCHGAAGQLVCVVAEVHNTYGERHCYLLRPDADGVARTDKEFYVSPFFPVDGGYRMRLPLPDTRLRLTVQLERGGHRAHVPFTASVHGERRPATVRELLRATARHPWPTLAVTVGIRAHGIRLWLRGLPVRPRPHHPQQKGLH
ncbi:DUF1365 domain-containing protein [Streptomyces reniochalinae]|uniref:DUF1365 domain-containing protein n=1 Tax=Streptomyces reniochalinae TaxID=2250578 RepID=A0A367ECM9_9ACTN|nr:DUF1365 domain-containing protein [Streptomyces reniochalinae]